MMLFITHILSDISEISQMKRWTNITRIWMIPEKYTADDMIGKPG